MISKGGASLCQLMTEPTGYSVSNNSAKALAGSARTADTFLIRNWKQPGISFPFDSDRLSKFQSNPKLATFRFASNPWKLKLFSSFFLISLISTFSSSVEIKLSMYWKPSGQPVSSGNNVFMVSSKLSRKNFAKGCLGRVTFCLTRY